MLLLQMQESSFQFTTSQGGRRLPEVSTEKEESFNSRPHKEVDALQIDNNVTEGIFQFTTSQGGRRILRSTTPQGRLSFNSRPHKEVDGVNRTRGNYLNLSIHDLTRRSTEKLDNATESVDFQFTTSQGGRHCRR